MSIPQVATLHSLYQRQSLLTVKLFAECAERDECPNAKDLIDQLMAVQEVIRFVHSAISDVPFEEADGYSDAGFGVIEENLKRESMAEAQLGLFHHLADRPIYSSRYAHQSSL